MEKIFLTGASSYLGSRFAALNGEQFEIHGLSRQDPDHPCDLKDFDEVTKQFNSFAPDIVLHTAADLGRDAKKDASILETNPAITRHLVELAQTRNIPFIFTSTEAIYGGKWDEGGYVEDDPPEPRALYGESKVLSEKIIRESGLPYLITRGHRYVGRNETYHRPKQFPDTMHALLNGEIVHLDDNKIFTPVHIDHLCTVFTHYIAKHSNEQIIVNVGTDHPTTFCEFILDIAKELDIDTTLIKDDGDESGWPQNSSLKFEKLKRLGFPTLSYDELVAKISEQYRVKV